MCGRVVFNQLVQANRFIWPGDRQAVDGDDHDVDMGIMRVELAYWYLKVRPNQTFLFFAGVGFLLLR